MEWLRAILFNWMTKPIQKKRQEESYGTAIPMREHPVDLQRATIITLADAMNGYVIQLQTWKPSKSPLHDDQRVVTTYVLKQGEPVVEAVAALLMNHKLEQK